MGRPHALMRVGFPYLKTIGMRRSIPTPLDVAFGKEGRIYVLCRNYSVKPLKVLTIDDESLYDVGPRLWLSSSGMPTPDELLWPCAVVVDSQENLYISDEGCHTISVCSKDDEDLGTWGEYGSGDGQLNRPSGLAVDSEDNLYVVDTLNHRVQKFTKDGKFLMKWGRLGAGEGEFNMPWGISIDEISNVYVGDWRNDRVQKFSADGEFILAFGKSGSGDGEFNRPAGVAVDMDGDIYVADWGNRRVQLFNHEGRYIQRFLGDATLSRSTVDYMMLNKKPLRLLEMGSVDGRKPFDPPRSVRVDEQGRMFVPDVNSYRVQVYQKEVVRLGPDAIAPPLRAATLMLA